LRGHIKGIRSLRLSPDESHLVSAARDRSVRVWDLETNQSVGDPLLHDDDVWAVVISPDEKYIVSGGLDGNIYVWSPEVALKHTGDDHSADESNAKPNAKLKERAARPRHVHQTVQPNNRGLAKYGKDFWHADTNSTHRHVAPLASPSPSIRWRNLVGPLRFSTRPPNAPQQIPLQPRRWNFGSFPVGISRRAVDVAPCRNEDRYGITPETDAEAAAAMQHTNSNEAGSSTRPDEPRAVPGTQVSQGQPTGTQDPSGGTEIVSCEVRCCGLFFSCGRPTVTS
jgi:hypothetical protein